MIEYKVVTLRGGQAVHRYDTSHGNDVDTADLNVLAREGWRVVACSHRPGVPGGFFREDTAPDLTVILSRDAPLADAAWVSAMVTE